MRLDLARGRDQRHLAHDALVAEDLAIRHADSARGLRSGQYESNAVYGQSRDACMATLFALIATEHGVTREQVRDALERRSLTFDLAIVISFFLVYYAVAGPLVIRRVSSGFPDGDDRVPRMIALILASLVLGVGAVGLGEMWAFLAEMLRVGNGHLSYRTSRMPWVLYRLELFTLGVAVFALIAMLRYRPASRQQPVA